MGGPGDVRGLSQRGNARAGSSGRSRVLTTFGVLGLLVGLLGLLARYRTPGSTFTLAISALSPYLVVGSLVAATLFAISRGTFGWLGLSVSVGLVLWSVVLQVPQFTAAAVPEGRDIVVMTANLRLGQAVPAAVVAAVRSRHVEVLMIEELTPAEADALVAAGLDHLLPAKAVDPRSSGDGGGLWSRYPLAGVDIRSDFAFSFITARVAVPGVAQPPTMVALHMAGPYPQIAGWLRDIHHLPGVLAALPSGSPTLVGGDFNSTPDVGQFRRLLHGGYADAGAQAGAGLLPTWPSDRFFPPVIGIDHILTRDAVAHRADTIEIPGSDHRALVVTVRLPG